MKKYSHAFSISFSVDSDRDGNDITAEELWAGILRRLYMLKQQELDSPECQQEIIEACGLPYDTGENEEEDKRGARFTRTIETRRKIMTDKQEKDLNQYMVFATETRDIQIREKVCGDDNDMYHEEGWRDCEGPVRIGFIWASDEEDALDIAAARFELHKDVIEVVGVLRGCQ